MPVEPYVRWRFLDENKKLVHTGVGACFASLNLHSYMDYMLYYKNTWDRIQKSQYLQYIPGKQLGLSGRNFFKMLMEIPPFVQLAPSGPDTTFKEYAQHGLTADITKVDGVTWYAAFNFARYQWEFPNAIPAFNDLAKKFPFLPKWQVFYLCHALCLLDMESCGHMVWSPEARTLDKITPEKWWSKVDVFEKPYSEHPVTIPTGGFHHSVAAALGHKVKYPKEVAPDDEDYYKRIKVEDATSLVPLFSTQDMEGVE